MLDLERLSLEELETLGRRAGEECGLRFFQIARAADPADVALQELLGKMAQDAFLQGQFDSEAGLRQPFGSGTRTSPDGARDFIRESIPSLAKGFGEGLLHRDIALFYAESLEEEASRFYRMLSEHAHETKVRTVFSDLCDRERGKLRFLREVVLQG